MINIKKEVLDWQEECRISENVVNVSEQFLSMLGNLENLEVSPIYKEYVQVEYDVGGKYVEVEILGTGFEIYSNISGKETEEVFDNIEEAVGRFLKIVGEINA